MRRLTAISLLLCSVVLSACSSVPMMSADEDREAKQFKAPANKARLYIYRNETLGAAIKVGLTVDGKLLGKTARGTYYAVDLPPGQHRIECHSENDDQITVDLKKGEVVFLWQEMKVGFLVARCNLHQVDEVTGRKGVGECQRAQARD